MLGVCSPPIVRSGVVFCPGAGVQAYNAASGLQLWTALPQAEFSLTQGTADAQRVYVGTNLYGTLETAVALDASTGSLQWQRSYETPEYQSLVMRSLTLSPEGDLLVVFEAEFLRNQIFSAVVIVAVDPATGDERWRYVDGDRTTNRSTGGLTIWENLMLYTDGTGQEAVAVDRATRQVAWRVALTPDAFAGVRPPLVRDGVAYFTDTQGGVFAVDARTGQQRWKTRQRFGYQSHEVCGDIVYGNDILGDVLDRATGRPLGRPLGEGDSMDQAAVADDVLYLSAASGVYAFDCTR